jgi:hypothetical protein
MLSSSLNCDQIVARGYKGILHCSVLIASDRQGFEKASVEDRTLIYSLVYSCNRRDGTWHRNDSDYGVH